MIGLIGKKVGMTRFFGQGGESISATAIQIGACHVVQVKDQDRHGYRAVQLGAFARRKKLVRKPELGHYAKAGVEPKAKMVEFRVENPELYKPGQELRADIFRVGDRVKVTGTSKGKGFAGGIKRHGFHGGPKTHGQSDRHRAPGSLGGSSYPSRVWKGKKMAGRMGNDRVSIRNLEVVQVDPENNLILLKGAVPGAKNGYVIIQRMTEIEDVAGTGPEAGPAAKEKPEAAEKKAAGGKKAAPAAKEKPPVKEPAAEQQYAGEEKPAAEGETADQAKPAAEAESAATPEAEESKPQQGTDPSERPAEKKDEKE